MENSLYEVEQPQVNFVREGLKMGVINGLFALLIMYSSYYMGLDAFVNVQIAAKFIPYMSIILIIYGFQLRKRNDGYLSFKEGVKYSYLSYIITALIVAAGTYILYNVINTELSQQTFDIALEKVRNSMQRSGMSQAEMDKVLGDSMKERPVTNFRTIIGGLGFELILDFVISIIIALIIRRERPVISQA